MSTMFVDAVRKKKKLRMLLAGPTDAGKTRTAIRLSFAIAAHEIKLASEKRSPVVLVIDTEHGRASFYKGRSDDGIPYQFKVCELNHFSPDAMIAVIREAWSLKPDVLILDSASHEWSGSGGALEMQSKQSLQKGYNSYSAWAVVTPKQNQFVEAILNAPFHVVATVRQKMDAVMEPDPEKPGRTRIRSIGLQDKQRDDFRYEFDVIGNISQDHELEFVKTPWDEMPRGPFKLAGPSAILPLINWLNEGTGEYEVKAFPEVSLMEPTLAEKVRATIEPTMAGNVGAGIENGHSNGNGTGHSTADRATDIQLSEISIAIQTLQLAGQPAAMLAKRGVARLEELTKAQAEEILGTLRTKVDAKKAELEKEIAEKDRADKAKAEAEAASQNPTPSIPTAPQSSESAQTSVPPSQQSAPSIAGTISDTNNNAGNIELTDAAKEDPDRVGSIHPHDITRLIDGCKKLLIGDDDLKRILTKRKTKSGGVLRCLPDMSHNQAQEMLVNLRTAYAKRFPNTAPF